MFWFFSQILGSFVLICSFDNYNFWPCITHMYIYHSRGVFLAGSGWFEGKILYFNTQIRVYHILFNDGRFLWHRPYFIVKFLLSLCILLICASSFNWFGSISISSFNLFLTLEVFLGPCIHPGHCSYIALNFRLI